MKTGKGFDFYLANRESLQGSIDLVSRFYDLFYMGATDAGLVSFSKDVINYKARTNVPFLSVRNHHVDFFLQICDKSQNLVSPRKITTIIEYAQENPTKAIALGNIQRLAQQAQNLADLTVFSVPVIKDLKGTIEVETTLQHPVKHGEKVGIYWTPFSLLVAKPVFRGILAANK